MNLLKTPPKYHRELFTWEGKVKTAKEEYLYADLWFYLCLSFLVPPSGSSVATQKSLNKEYIEYLKTFVSEEHDFYQKELTKYVETPNFNLEEFLFAIDILADYTGVLPSIPTIHSKLNEARTKMKMIELRSKLG